MKIRRALFLLLMGGLLFLAPYAEAADLGQFGGGDGRGDTMAEIVRLFAGGDGRGDAMAEILGQTMGPITVTSPNGGENWMVGTAHDITWTSGGTVGNVDIHCSLNSGSTWTLIARGEANDGLYSWTIPTVTPSATCLVRIQEVDGDPTDQSDAVFSIIAYADETISTPSTPSGPTTGMEGAIFKYSTGGSGSNWDDPVQYRFDWNDGTYSEWLAVGVTEASHAWLAAGTYNVRAMARCSIHTDIVSELSTSFTVTLDETPTWVAVSHFEACESESQPTVEWHTASEQGAVGFNLWRQDRETKQYDLVNPGLLPALPGSPQGGVYRFADPGAFSGEPVIYRLEEIDAQGRSMSYGPFTVTFGAASWDGSDETADKAGREEPSGIYGYQCFERGRSVFEQERLQERRRELQRSSLLAATGKERAKITVRGRGLFYVTSAQVARSLGLVQPTVEHLISGKNLRLTSMGKNIAWLADRNGAGLFFYNEGLQTPYSDRNVFWLERGSGLAMETVSGGNAGPADAGQTFSDSLYFEENHFALLISSMDPAGDLWFWDYVVSGGAARPFIIQVPGVAATGNATLNIRLQGATDTTADIDHHAIVSLNGTQIGEALWDGTRTHEFTVEFAASLLQDGANTVMVSGALDTGVPYSTFYVEDLDLSCQRYYRAVDNSLLCRGDGNSVVTVSGMTELQAVVLDVSNPVRPKYLSGVAPDVSGRVTFVPRSAANTYLVSGLNASLRPLAVVGDSPSQLKATGNSAEHVVIVPEEFKETAKTLAAYRRGKGLKSLVVTLEDIYESFSYGMPNPRAIRDFLAYAYAKWGGNKVKYAILAGKGTYDYNDYQGYGDNLVPVQLGATPYGLCATDKMFGDVKGANGLPEIAIGRLPAVTNAELQAMIGKIKAYEAGRGAWTDRALFIADNADSGGDFAAGCNELAGLATGLQAEKIYLADSVAETRSRIIASWNAGMALVNYCGHAGLDQLAVENIFNVSAARSLSNGGQLPLSVMLTCVAGRFELPGFTCLNETLLLNENGGSAGGLAPSGAGMHADSMRLGAEFYKAALRGRGMTAGQALLEAMKNYLQQGGPAYMLNIYNWLGDPALKAK